jgi:activator of 2-hydroxyglutaryl-CoA dehydratase
MTGGVSKNEGVRLSLEKKLALKVTVPEMSQFAGAYGAAIIANESAVQR